GPIQQRVQQPTAPNATSASRNCTSDLASGRTRPHCRSLVRKWTVTDRSGRVGGEFDGVEGDGVSELGQRCDGAAELAVGVSVEEVVSAQVVVVLAVGQHVPC